MSQKHIRIATLCRDAQSGVASAITLCKGEFRNRDAARAALLPAFATVYKAPTLRDDAGKVVGFVPSKKKGVYEGTGNAAQQALKRLLSAAYPSKKGKQPSKFDADKVASRIASNYSPAQLKRIVVALRGLI